jgi:hypothetical protein
LQRQHSDDSVAYLSLKKRPGALPAFSSIFFLLAGLPARLAALASAAATTSAVAASASASSSAAKAALRARARFIDIDRAAIEFVAVESLDSFSRRVRFHFNERETARAARIPISHYRGGFHLSNFRKQIGELILRRLIRQVSYKYSHCLS